VRRRPVRLGRSVERTRADENDVGERTHQTHHETIVFAASRNQAARFVYSRQRGNAVETFDEVRVYTRRRKSDGAAIGDRKLVRQFERGKIGFLEEHLQLGQRSAYPTCTCS